MDLKERINQLNDIQVGFVNVLKEKLGLLDDSIIEEGLRRASICKQCPLLSGQTCNPKMEGEVVKDFVYYGKQFKKGDKNNGCGCSMSAKWLSSQALCPLNKFSKDL